MDDSNPELRQPNILIADDEPTITDTLAIILRNSGFHTASAYSGEQAVEAARASRPDILVADVVMHGITGIEAALQIRVLAPRCKVILISGEGPTSPLIRDAHAQGHRFEVLSKPFHPSELIEKLRA